MTGRVSATIEVNTWYSRGREYDVSAIDPDGSWELKQVKFRDKNAKGRWKSAVKVIPGKFDDQLEKAGRTGRKAAQAFSLAKQAKFDTAAISQSQPITLRGKGVPGGEITLQPGEYSIVYVIIDSKGQGKAVNATAAEESTDVLRDLADEATEGLQ